MGWNTPTSKDFNPPNILTAYNLVKLRKENLSLTKEFAKNVLPS